MQCSEAFDKGDALYNALQLINTTDEPVTIALDGLCLGGGNSDQTGYASSFTVNAGKASRFLSTNIYDATSTATLTTNGQTLNIELSNEKCTQGNNIYAVVCTGAGEELDITVANGTCPTDLKKNCTNPVPRGAGSGGSSGGVTDPPTVQKTSGLSKNAIIGIIVGAVALLIIVIIIAAVSSSKSKNQ